MNVLVSEVKLCYNEDRFKFCDNLDDFVEQTLKFHTQENKNMYHFRVKEHTSHTTTMFQTYADNKAAPITMSKLYLVLARGLTPEEYAPR